MKYKLLNQFMLRCPSLSLKNYYEINSNINNIDYIEKNNLKNYLEELLLISSLSTYNSYQENKINENVKDTINKYLIRASTRSTPYGNCAGVEMGVFSDYDNLKIDTKGFKNIISVDAKWLYDIKKELLKDIDFMKNTKLYSNKNLIIDKNKVKNPQVSSCFEEEKHDYSIIENNNLIKLILDNSKNGIVYSNLVELISEEYEGVQEELVIKVLSELIESEFLMTELLGIVFSENSLKNFIELLLKYKNDYTYLNTLIKIDEKITEYNECNEMKTLKEIIELMKSIKSDEKDYICCCRKINLKSNTISSEVKKELEENINEIVKLYEYYTPRKYNLSKFKNKFTEIYGLNSCVPIIDIIDKNKFGGIELFEKNLNDYEYDDVVNGEFYDIVESKILAALQNQEEEINLSIDDFKNLKKKEEKIYFNPTLDLNVIIIKEKENYIYNLAPNVGSYRGGNIYNRFESALDGNIYKNFVDEIKYYDDKYEKENNELLIEIRENFKNPRMHNIRSYKQINNNYMAFSLIDLENKKSISISELYLKLNNNDEFEIIHLGKNKKCRIINNDMLNLFSKSKLSKFLYILSNNIYTDIFNVIGKLYLNKYNYLPRIKMKNMILKPKEWNLSKGMLSNKNIEEFSIDLKKAIERYSINRFVYLSDSDNRLLLDLNNEYYYKIIYKQFKKKGYVLFEENEFMNKDMLMTDIENNKYMSEISFTLVIDEIEKVDSEEKNIINYTEEMLPMQDGWIYFKIYGVDEMEEELLLELKEISMKKDIFDKAFFIRYADEKGQHIRFRVKIKSEKENKIAIKYLQDKFTKMYNCKYFGNLEIDTYYREINRYGGKKMIDDVETFFEKDSMLVYDVLKYYTLKSKEDQEKAYIIGIISVLKSMYDNDEKLMEDLEFYTNSKENRDEYRKNRKKYMKIVEEVYNESFNYEEEIRNDLLERKSILKDIKNKMEKIELTNERHNIIFSMIHMYCNRLKGDNSLEHKYISIVRNSLHDIINKNKNLMR